MAMIAEAAASYDKYSPAAVSLDAFEGANMTPPVFKEQLRRLRMFVRPASLKLEDSPKSSKGRTLEYRPVHK